ncbi:MAG TPA: YhjD/YihY/BrkB family envelope integrity protein [Actinomycetota bacterium]|jgi:membrane protein|nr:YhjD/YihY/BrkB family envelope integrity protein [Actinomycetota bacterium]
MTIPPALRDFSDRWKRDRTALAAAGVTYHWFLAVFPLLFAVVATITLLGNAISEDVVRSTIEQVAPAGADKFLTDLVSNAQSSTSPQSALPIVLAVIVALISTSSGMAALLQGMEVAAEAPPRPFIRRRVLAFVLVIATLLLAAVGVAIGIAVANIIDVGWLVSLIHQALTVLVTAAVIAAIWAARPTGTGPRRLWTVGSIFATVAIVVASLAMALFATRFGGSFARTYGALANLVVLLIWFFVVSLAVLVGAEIDAVRTHRSDAANAGMSEMQRKEDPMETEETPNSYRCDLCGRTFDTQEQLRQHWDEEHADTPAVGATPRH